MTAFLAFIASRWQAALGLAAALAVLLYGRHQRTTGRAERETEIRAQAAQQMQERTNAGNDAARAAERDGALDRMRDGKF
jgi:dienelactone hydrolase